MDQLQLLVDSAKVRTALLTLNDSATTVDTFDLSQDSFRLEGDNSSVFEYDACSKKSALRKGHTKQKQNVTFGCVTLRHYKRTVSYNPCLSGGPSVGLDWNYVEETSFGTVDDFDEQRPVKDEERNREQPGFYLSADQRYSLLLDWGFDEFDIISSMYVVANVNHQRIQTLRCLRRKAQLKELKRWVRNFFPKVPTSRKQKLDGGRRGLHLELAIGQGQKPQLG